MRKLLLVVTLGLCLAGCINPLASTPNPASPKSLYAAELTFDAAVKTFNELKSLCANHALPASCRGYVVQGQGYIRQAYAADLAARQFVENNPTLDATNVIQAFLNVVSTFKTTLADLSATKG